MRFTPRKTPFALGAIFALVVMVGLFGAENVDASGGVTGAIYNFATGQAQLDILLSTLTSIINAITWGIGKMLLLVIDAIVVPILQYNSFSSSEIIGKGWMLVRDVVNMFVVIVLLVIAVATIVGYKKVSWEQALPQFLLAVILVNFSRTICGLLIDVSQVIMFTFVNALLDVAVGNFANMFQLNVFGTYAWEALRDAATGDSTPITAAQNLAAAYLTFVLYAVIFAIMFLLALVFLWRIVLLWVLVIMSPLTFFLGGLGGLFKFAEGASGEWWKKFTACLVLGPMLTFFLWLALSAASGGTIAESENFPMPEQQAAVVLDALTTSKFTSILLGLILLVVGMQQSASFANSMGGVASQFINEKTAKGLVGGVMSRAGGYAASRIGAEATRIGAQGVVRAGGAFGAINPNLGSSLPGRALSGTIGAATGLTGRAMIGAVGYAQQKVEKYQKQGADEAKKSIGEMTDDQKIALSRVIASGKTAGFAINPRTKDEIRALQMEFATKAGTREKLGESMSAVELQAMNDGALRYGEANKDSMDAATKEQFNKFKTDRAHDLNRVLGAGSLGKHIESSGFKVSDLSAAAVADAEVMKALNERNSGKKGISVGDEVRQGIHGKKLREASGLAPITTPMYSDVRTRRTAAGGFVPRESGPSLATAAITPEAIVTNIALKNIRVGELSVDDFNGPNLTSLTQALLQSEKGFTGVKDPAARTMYETEARRLATLPGGIVDPKQRLFYDSEQIKAGVLTEPTFNSYGTRDDIERAIGVIRKRPEYLDKFNPEVMGGNTGAQEAVARGVTGDRIEALVTQHENSNNSAERARIETSIQTLIHALQEHGRRAVTAANAAAATAATAAGRTAPKPLKLRDVDSEMDSVYRRLMRIAPHFGSTMPPI